MCLTVAAFFIIWVGLLIWMQFFKKKPQSINQAPTAAKKSDYPWPPLYKKERIEMEKEYFSQIQLEQYLSFEAKKVRLEALKLVSSRGAIFDSCSECMNRGYVHKIGKKGSVLNRLCTRCDGLGIVERNL